MSSSVNYSTGFDGGGSECNVVLGLNMESTYPTNPSPYHHPQHPTSIQFGGCPRLFDTSTQIAGGRKFEMVFTASQLQEFEKQTIIYNHLISSIPVPPHLLPLSTQSNRSDSEPWRCKRTDGKKWRCSRDVMPDQRYCERHAHKNKPRSRKPVETQSQNIKNLKTKHNYHSTLPPAPAIPTSCQQSRCKEWFMKPMCSPSVGSKRDYIFQNLEGNLQDLFERDTCSLTLMQPGGNDAFNDQDQDFFQMGMLNEDGSNQHNQWLNQGSWLGGPLGEALCPLNRPPNVSTPHYAGCGLH